MPANLPVREFEGLILSLDRRRLAKASVVDGRNFLVDVDGPYSAFGTKILSYTRFYYPEMLETVLVEAENWLVSAHGLFRYDIVSDQFYPIYIFDTPITTVDNWPWSSALVGGKYYFCHPGTGVIEYDPATGAFTVLTTAVPVNPKSLCSSNGRLVILGDSEVAWSALDDGADLTPDLTTGAGTQRTALIGGETMRVLPFGGGFLVYTKTGILRADYSAGLTPFRFIPLTTQCRPLNPYCVVALDEYQHIILDQKGLYFTDGKVPVPWQPLFSEYLTRQVLSNLQNYYDLPIFRLTYSSAYKLFFISMSTSGSPEMYGIAYTLYMVSEKWGSFNKTHLGIGMFDALLGVERVSVLGYIDESGYIHRFDSVPYHEVPPMVGDANFYFYREHTEIPARVQDGRIYFPMVGHASSVNEEIYAEAGTGLFVAGFSSFVDDFPEELNEDVLSFDAEYEDWNLLSGSEDWNLLTGSEDWGDEPLYTTFVMSGEAVLGLNLYYPERFEPELVSLDAQITVGLFRFTEEQNPDELSLVRRLVVHMAKGAVEETVEDWNTIGGGEDWLNDIAPGEDWGYQIASAVDYGVTFQATNDGYQVVEQQIPHLEQENASARFFSLESHALFHHVTIYADEPLQSFHLKSLEMSGIIAGRLI